MKQFSVMVVILILAVGLLAGCGQATDEAASPEPSPSLSPSPTFAGLDTLPTFSDQVATPTLPIQPVDFPILPDPAGEALYNTYCAECHGLEGEGQYPDDPYAPNEQGLLGAPPHDNTGHTWHHPDPVLFRIIYEGQTAPGFLPMPAFKDQLTPDQIIAILAYIKTWWGERELEVQISGTEAYLNQ